MPVRRRYAVAVTLMMLSAVPPATAAHAQTASPTLIGRWRVQSGRVAPWVKSTDPRPNTRSWLGTAVEFSAARVRGTHPLDCGGARYEASRTPAQGLFMGGFETQSPAAARTTAQSLGFAAFPVRGTSLTCDKGIFEFHFADTNAALVAVDNVIWTLDRSPGALAAAGTPEATVQSLLETHFAGGMAFEETTVKRLDQYLSRSFVAAAQRYFARPKNPNEVPDIDGDVFTDSQEYPTRFSVGAAVPDGMRRLVPVRMSDGYGTKRVTYVLVRDGAAWRVDDVRYARMQPTLRATLK